MQTEAGTKVNFMFTVGKRSQTKEGTVHSINIGNCKCSIAQHTHTHTSTHPPTIASVPNICWHIYNFNGTPGCHQDAHSTSWAHSCASTTAALYIFVCACIWRWKSSGFCPGHDFSQWSYIYTVSICQSDESQPSWELIRLDRDWDFKS